MNTQDLSKKQILILFGLLVCICLLADSWYGETAARQETRRIVEKSLESQSGQVIHAFETYDQSLQMIRLSLQSQGSSQLNYAGQLIHEISTQVRTAHLSGRYSRSAAEAVLKDILAQNDRISGLKTTVLPNVSKQTSGLNTLIRKEIETSEHQVLADAGNLSRVLSGQPITTELHDKGTLTVQSVHIQYDGFFDWVIISKNTPRSETADKQIPSALSNSQKLTLDAIAGIGDVFVQQTDGYAIYSGKFGETAPIQRIVFVNPQKQAPLLKQLKDNVGRFSEIPLPMPNGTFQTRLCYIQYDISRHQYIVVSRSLTDLNRQTQNAIKPIRFIVLINLMIMLLICHWLTQRGLFGPLEEDPALKTNLRRLKVGLFALTLLFFIFFQGLLRIQFLKHSMDEEYALTMQTEASYLETAYKNFNQTFAATRSLAQNEYAGEAKQLASTVAAIVEAASSGHSEQEALRLLAPLNGVNGRCFWVLDESGKLLSSPGKSYPEVEITYPATLLEQLQGRSAGPVQPSTESKGLSSNAYGIRMLAGGWSVLAILPESEVQRKLNSYDSLRAEKINQLISEFSHAGSAAIVSKDLRFIHYAYQNLEGKSVDSLSVEQGQKLSELMFHEQNGYFDYVMYDPIIKKAKHRNAYVNYSRKSGLYFLVSTDKAEMYKDLNHLSANYLKVIGALGVILIIGNSIFLIRHFTQSRQEDNA